MSAARIWDISPEVSSDLPVWPDDTPFSQLWSWRIAEGQPVNLSSITMSAHTGAHIDAPLHTADGAAAASALDLEPFLGPCRVVDATAARGLVEPSHVEPHLDGVPARVLLKSRPAPPPVRWDPGFIAIAPETVVRLADASVQLVGIDTPSFDPFGSEQLAAHHAARERGLAILEGLVLHEVPPGDYELIALPLKLAGLDGSPVRAVLRELR